jgi:hypothetical protein
MRWIVAPISGPKLLLSNLASGTNGSPFQALWRYLVKGAGWDKMTTMLGSYISSVVHKGPHSIWSPPEPFLVHCIPNGHSSQPLTLYTLTIGMVPRMLQLTMYTLFFNSVLPTEDCEMSSRNLMKPCQTCFRRRGSQELYVKIGTLLIKKWPWMKSGCLLATTKAFLAIAWTCLLQPVFFFFFWGEDSWKSP